MLRIGGVMFFMGLVVLGNGSILIWRSRSMQRAGVTHPALTKRIMQFRDAGVVTAFAGVVVVLGSFLIIAKRGF